MQVSTCPALLVHDSLDRSVHNITARNIRTFAAFARIWTCQQLPHYTPHWPKELQYPLAWDRVRLWKDADCMGAAAKAASPQATRFLDPVLRTMNYVPLSWGFHQMRRCYKTPQLATGPLSWLSVVPLGNQDPLLGQWDCCEDDNCVTSPRLPAAGLSCPGGQCVASPVLCCVSLSMLCVHPSLRTTLYWSCRPLHLATHCTPPDPDTANTTLAPEPFPLLQQVWDCWQSSTRKHRQTIRY